MLIDTGNLNLPQMFERPRIGLRCLLCGYSIDASERGGRPLSWVIKNMNEHLTRGHTGNKYQETLAKGNTDLMLLWIADGIEAQGFTRYLRGVAHDGLYFPTKIVRKTYTTKGASQPWPVETCFSPTGKFLWETYSLDPKNPTFHHSLVVCPDLVKLHALCDRSTLLWNEYLHAYMHTPDDQKADYLALLELQRELT